MKKHLFLSAAVLSVFIGLFSSCGEDVSSSAGAKGRIAPLVGVESDIIEAEIVSRSLSVPNIKVSDLFFRVTSADGSYSREWPSVKDFSADEEFAIGDYTVEVGYADPKAEGLKCTPAYYASQDIKIYENQTTPVSLSATRTHAYVSVTFSEAVKSYFRRVAVDVKSDSGKKTITFLHSPSYTETSTACIVPGDVVVHLDLEKKNGVKSDNIEIAKFTADARGHYHIDLEVNEGEIGSETLIVSFDDNTDQHYVEVELSDEMLTTPAPEMTIEGVENGGTLEFVEGCYLGEPVKVIVNARGAIASVNLDTHSTFLRDTKPWPLSVDLVNASSDDRDNMIDVGLDCKGIWSDPNREPSRMGYIDFTQVINNIGYLDLDPTHNNECSFTLTATDHNRKSTETPVVFYLKIKKLNLGISNPSVVKFFETSMSVDLTFNGGDAVKDIVFSAKDEDSGTGEYKTLKVDKIEPLGENSYRVHLSDLPVYGSEVNLRVQFGKNIETLIVNRTGVIVSTTDNDIFATRAYITLTPVNVDQAEIATPTFILKSENNKELKATKQADNVYLVEGLSCNDKTQVLNQLTAKVSNPDIQFTSVEFLTEVAAQLENSNLDEWTKDAHSSYNVEYFVGGPWSTFNPITISQWNNSANMAYCATSGTIETTESASGKAALIRTVGWGRGNTASANAFNQWSFGSCKYVTRGELFLGDWIGITPQQDAEPNYGTKFASRPSALSFQYKYFQNNRRGNDNGDFGTAQIKVLDDEGVVIHASEEIHLTLKDSYTEGKIELNYPRGSKKAAKLIVIFRSSGNSNAWTANENYMKPAPPLNLNDGEYVGSQLYIDDVKLIY